jgi:hypothetical protein
MAQVQNDKGQFADNWGTIFAAQFPDQPLVTGGRYSIQPGLNSHNGSIIPVPGNWIFESPGYLSVEVTSMDPGGWIFTTDPSQHFLDGTVSFSSADAGNGNITFTISAQGNYTSNFFAILGPLINAGEDSTWTNMLKSIQGYCQLVP